MDRRTELRDRFSQLGLELCSSGNTNGVEFSSPFEPPCDLSMLQLERGPNGVIFLPTDDGPSQTWGSCRGTESLFADKHLLERLEAVLKTQATAEGTWQDYSFLATKANMTGRSGFLIFLMENAVAEAPRFQENRHWRTANSLRRVGRSIHEHNKMEPLCRAFAHEVVYSSEIAACMVWIHNSDTQTLKLMGCAGVNRLGEETMDLLTSVGGVSCAAEMVAQSWKPLAISELLDHILTANLEGQFCYLPPGSGLMLPLFCDDELIAVVEFVGRAGSPSWAEDTELFEVLADHLSLALRSAKLFEKYEQLASHDSLTGLSNHRTINEFVHRRVAEGDRTGQGLGLAMIDVDHFRSFNEEEGHDAGDEVLKLVAEVLNSCLRPYDIAARYGGEEFTVAMPGSTWEGLVTAAERMRAKIEAIDYVTRSGRNRTITASIGCALYPLTTNDASELFKAADTALYRAKRNGRNRVESYAGRFTEEVGARVYMFDLSAWMTSDEMEDAHRRAGRLEPELRKVCSSMRLSPSQQRILHTLLLVTPAYCVHRESGTLEIILESEAYRLLGPSLEALGERFDGMGPRKVAGPKIPLLARAADVLLSLDSSPNAFSDDPNRFDPEIISVLSESDQAA